MAAPPSVIFFYLSSWQPLRSSRFQQLWYRTYCHSVQLLPLLTRGFLLPVMAMIGYLSQSGAHHPKHGGGILPKSTSPTLLLNNKVVLLLPPLHPSLAFIIHYVIAIPSILYVHDSFFSNPYDHGHIQADDSTSSRRQTLVSRFLLAYTLILFSARYLSSYRAGRLRHHSVLYEFTWLCNSTLILGCLSFGSWYDAWLFRRRPLIATACCVAVSIDQILWYVDLIVWAVSGKFPIGVMKYLTWKQTPWIDRFTCTHHLWTIPLLLFGANGSLNWDAFKLSIYIVVTHVLLSRWLTPPFTESGTKHNDGNDNRKDPQRYRYLNVNLSHELWKDISFGWLQISFDNPSCWTYLFRLLWRWQLFNGLIFIAILRPLSTFVVA